jgi:uncharacterized integral membrane protein
MSRYSVKFNVVGFIICIVFLSVFVGMTAYTNINMPSFNLISFPIIGIILLSLITGYFVYWMAVKRSKSITKDKNQKEEYLSSLKQSSKNDEKTIEKVFCHECGTEVAKNESICSRCGTIVKG